MHLITIDLNPTDDPTHGAQQSTLFNRYYDNWCYLPLLAFVRFDREQYLCAALLQRGKAVASDGGGRHVVPPAAAVTLRISAGAAPRSTRRGLCNAGGLRLPGGPAAARRRGRDGEEVAARGGAGHAGGASAELV
ncbi:MAG: transposase [Acidobacteria bacterium]|nr:transposase [Acidobacteriota bacterium]